MNVAHRPSVRFLTDDQVEAIVADACRVLETTGVLVENDDARALLRDSGSEQRDGRFRIRERSVRECVASAPHRCVVYDRNGEPALDLCGDNVHFDPGSAAIFMLDSSGRRRDATTEDAVHLARLVDALPCYQAQSTAVVPSDVPKEIADRYRLYLVLKNSRKPVITGTFSKRAFAPMARMLSAVRGGDAALRERPLAIFDCCPSPPLKWSDLTCQALIDCARAGIPAELVSMPLTGATSPVTLREAIVQHCAENLSGIVIHQSAHKGAPIIYGGSPSAFDMRHGTTPMGAIETMMIDVAYAQVGKQLGLPTHAYMGLSDAKTNDYQAGFESGMGILLAALGGINVVSGAGMLDFESTQSLEKVLLDHDLCAMAKRLIGGIQSRPSDVTQLFAELVRAGEFLSHPHTRAHWRSELLVASTLVDRKTHGDWEAAGGKSAQQRATQEVQRRLAESRPEPLPSAVLEEITGVMRAEAARCELSALPA